MYLKNKKKEVLMLDYKTTYPRAISKLLMSFLIFQISTLRSADVSSDIFGYLKKKLNSLKQTIINISFLC